MIVGVLVSLLLLRYRNDSQLSTPVHFKRFAAAFAYCFTAYALSLLPYVGVTRAAFIYHYMPALLYGEIAAALIIERLAGDLASHAFRVTTFFVVAIWVYFAPWVYYLPLPQADIEQRRWLKSWD